jgi:predicted dinucleotide-binding enzyme
VKIGIIGAGRMGLGLGRRWIKAGHDVFFSYSHDLAKLQSTLRAENLAAQVGPPAAAADFADTIVLAVTWAAVNDALGQAGSLAGKNVITLVNPMNASYSELVVGHSTSAAEEIARIAHGAHVVEALNTVFAETLHSETLRFGEDVPTVFFCGDDALAKQRASELISSLGLEGVDAGPLTAARCIEPLGLLFTRLAYGRGLGAGIAPKMLRR